jgi:hypothetical protein
MSHEEKEQFKETTVRDPKFWLGLASFLFMYATTLIYLGQFKEQLKNLEGVRDRVIKTETRVDSLDARVHTIESYTGVGSNRELLKQQPQ